MVKELSIQLQHAEEHSIRLGFDNELNNELIVEIIKIAVRNIIRYFGRELESVEVIDVTDDNNQHSIQLDSFRFR